MVEWSVMMQMANNLFSLIVRFIGALGEIFLPYIWFYLWMWESPKQTNKITTNTKENLLPGLSNGSTLNNFQREEQAAELQF